MFLDSPTQTLEVSFRVRHGDGYYVVYASKCFECGDVGNKRFACPHKNAGEPSGFARDSGDAIGAESRRWRVVRLMPRPHGVRHLVPHQKWRIGTHWAPHLATQFQISSSERHTRGSVTE